ncbi:hypothetical protein BKI52_09830 [marine bacterium AO1-C]|nr:hypothetical protein BKI52_09830 [marine bacterium AO1-C]
MSINNLFQLIRNQSKYNLSGIKNEYLITQIHHHQQKAGITDDTAFYEYLLKDSQALKNLTEACLNNATRFFRNPQLFEILRYPIFPDLLSKKIHAKQPLKIWVTACSTGDEAYSLAIILQELLIELSSPIEVQILATDLSAEAIQTAKEGGFIGNNLIDVNADLRKKYFTYREGRYYIKSIIKNYVNFVEHDFLNPQKYPVTIPADFDIIICRNALLYYKTASQVQVIQYLYKHLTNNGLLILSEFELMPIDCIPLFQKSVRAPYIFSKK